MEIEKPAEQTAPESQQAEAPAPALVSKEELLRERFDAVAARVGLQDDYIDVVSQMVHKQLEAEGQEATKENVTRALQVLKKAKPALFVTPTVPNTAPALAQQPSAPVNQVESHYSRWRALIDSGRRDEATAYYRMYAGFISRGH